MALNMYFTVNLDFAELFKRKPTEDAKEMIM